MPIEPIHRQFTRADTRAHSGANWRNPYDGRWLWWYDAIANWLLRNPGGRLEDCAKELGRGRSTVQMIAASDTFKTYYEKRKVEFRQCHDEVLTAKLLGVAADGLDALQAILKKRGDQVPMQVLAPMVEGVLDRLGFAPKSSPAVVIDASTNNDNRIVNLPPTVSATTLEEARMAMRQVEAQKMASISPAAVLEGEAEVEPTEPLLVGSGSVDSNSEVEAYDAPPDRS